MARPVVCRCVGVVAGLLTVATDLMVRLKGMPWGSSIDDVVAFFEGISFPDPVHHIFVTNDKRCVHQTAANLGRAACALECG